MAKIISFVSGKGGVGKTSIAANYAWVSSQSRKTALIDLDLQNQGLSGLLEHYTADVAYGAFESLSSHHLIQDIPSCLVEVSKQLLFLPATSSNSEPSAIELADLVADPRVGRSIRDLVTFLSASLDCEFMILDCHGGLDYLSLGAHRASDITIMVTEADTVTFNGTLELLNFYRAIPHEMGADGERSLREPSLVQLIVNRIPPKYTFRDLEQVYSDLTRRIRKEYRLAPNVLSFFPQEDFLATSFGEYPFCTELAPNSVFNKKLWVLDFELSEGSTVKTKSRMSQKVRSKRFRNLVKRCLISNEALNTRRMLAAFSVLTLGFFLYILVCFPLLFIIGDVQTFGNRLQGHALGTSFLSALLLALCVTILWSLISAIWGAIRLNSYKYAFHQKLWTAFGRRLRFGERVILGRLMIMRIALFFPLIFFCITMIEALIAIPVLGYGLYTGDQGSPVNSSPIIRPPSPH